MRVPYVHTRILYYYNCTKNMVSQVDKAFCFYSIVRGHHVCKTMWMLFWRKTLTSTPELSVEQHCRWRHFSALILLIHRISKFLTSGSAALRPVPSSCLFFPESFTTLSLFLLLANSLFIIWAATVLQYCEA